MYTILQLKELGDFVDHIVNSEIGKRINEETALLHPKPEGEEDYPDLFWDELNRRHIEMLEKVIAQLRDPKLPLE
jgi:hypothetical protein